MRNIIKWAIVVLILVAGGCCLANAQQRDAEPHIGLAVYQDVALAIWEDGNGLTPFTFNPTVKAKFFGIDNTEYGHFNINAVFTYAELSPEWKGKLYRYGLEAGYAFTYMHIGKFQFTLNPMIGAGFLSRQYIDTYAKLSIEVSCEVSIRLSDDWKVNILPTLMERPDLIKSKNTNILDWTPNVSVGLEYVFELYKSDKTPGKAACNKRRRSKRR